LPFRLGGCCGVASCRVKAPGLQGHPIRQLPISSVTTRNDNVAVPSSPGSCLGLHLCGRVDGQHVTYESCAAVTGARTPRIARRTGRQLSIGLPVAIQRTKAQQEPGAPGATRSPPCLATSGTRRSVAHGRAISNGCTFAPPAIRGFDGSKCSRSSRFLTSARATTNASFRLLAWRSAMLKKASPK
jgi:hypothetical protein